MVEEEEGREEPLFVEGVMAGSEKGENDGEICLEKLTI